MLNSRSSSVLRNTALGLVVLSPLLAVCMVLFANMTLSARFMSPASSVAAHACFVFSGLVLLWVILSRVSADNGSTSARSPFGEILRMGSLGMAFVATLMLLAPSIAAGMDLSGSLLLRTNICGLFLGAVSLLLLAVV